LRSGNHVRFKIFHRYIDHGGPVLKFTSSFIRLPTLSHIMTQCQVGVVMGSQSDWDTMQHAASILQEFGIAFETRVVSAHRMPDDMFAYAESAQSRGLRAIIAGAGGAAHLPGMLAAKTTVPVLGVPVASKHLQGVDSLHSIVQMPKGIPVATFAIGEAGAVNAALFAVAMLANSAAAIFSAADSKTSDTKTATNPASNADLLAKLDAYRARQTEYARNMTLPPKA
jgi:5-(carboxyamino)imidazole ribonucleotide mutase